ncbi:MFS transporter [Plantactinospora sp. KLBMP9567]|uniref:MFS transporter n=1 Tax=Plantactinospora sp. KLBMP9567 TaxID=3085900 RepID=UPI00298290B6|nr:MFS transporter [Plantactinospora sp. KLBMP9567]MDW5322276.1 MFS transporter [Plantactinospora sp. KLBMP9567]
MITELAPATTPPPEPAPEPAPPRDHSKRDFRLLWFGQGVSTIGSEITEIALPFTALVFLGASATEIGILSGLKDLAGLVLTLFAGVLVDRMRRRRLMIAADLGRFLALGIIPLLALGGILSMPILYVAAFVVGCLTVVFNLAYPAFVGSLLENDRLINANSKLEGTQQIAGVVGPGLGGILVQALRAPFAIAVDALSFLLSALSLSAMRHRESEDDLIRGETGGVRGVFRDIKEGLAATFGNPHLRALAAEAATFNLFSQIVMVLFLVYASRDVGLSAGVIGVVFAVGSVGGTLGALITGKLVDRIGVGPALVWSTALTVAPMVALPFISGPKPVQAVLFGAVYLIVGLGIVISAITSITMRQTITPSRMRGRVNASFRFVTIGVIPIGAVGAGLLGDWIGLHNALYVSAVGTPLALLWLIFSPVPKVRTLDEITPKENR